MNLRIGELSNFQNYELKKLIPNTFQIKASCRRLLEFSTVDELLRELPEIKSARDNGSLLIIGRGSNLLPTKDYDGLVVRSRIMGREVLEENTDSVLLRCGSGETVDEVIAWSIANGYHGMENLSLIPGEVGASAVQNIGAYGVEAKDVIESVDAVEIETGKMVNIKNVECQYAYRHSLFKTEWKNRFVIVAVSYRLTKAFTAKLEYGNIKSVLEEKGIVSPTAQQLRDTIIEIRNAKLPDPEVEGNAGSFFMNPVVSKAEFQRLLALYPNMPHYKVDEENEKIPAGWLIDQCGWKGRTIGNAGVHAKQALVLVNRGGAMGEEILSLCRAIRKDVKDKFGVEINPEVNII